MTGFLPPGKESFSTGEVCRWTGLKPHVVRYWESAIGLVRPARRGSGHRRYTRREIETLQRARSLVEERGFTLAGVKRFLRQESRRPAQMSLGFQEAEAAVEVLKGVKREIAALLKDMKSRAFPPM